EICGPSKRSSMARSQPPERRWHKMSTNRRQQLATAVRTPSGKVHTNGLENFWSLLKRGIHGTYVSVEPFHLFRYLDEQSFRYNHRKDMNDAERFSLAVSQIVGKRLTYKELIGKAAMEKQKHLFN